MRKGGIAEPMNERTNYSGHYSGQHAETRPQGIVFRFGANHRSARFSPYMWLSHADYYGRELKLDFGRYDVVIRSAVTFSLDIIFEAIVCHECREISEKEGSLSIEIIEKEDVPAAS